MSRHLRVEDLTVDAIDDGVVRLPPTYYPGADFARSPGSLGEHGTYDIPIGCFLVRGPSRTVLVDAGLGPAHYPFPPEVAELAGLSAPPDYIAEGGRLLDGLAALGVTASEIDVVVLTHLHADHIGWIAPCGSPTFTSAEVLCSAEDWAAPLIDPAPGEAEGRAGLDRLAASGGLRTLARGRHDVAPGVVAEVQGGHTVGHTVVNVGTREPGVILVGDAVHHPDQLTDRGVSFLLETDPTAALHTREELFGRVAGQGVALGMSHWRGLDFQLVDLGPTRVWRAA